MIGAIPGVAKQPSGYRISRHCTKFFEKSRAAVNEVNRLSFYAMANDPSLRLCISRPYRLYENACRRLRRIYWAYLGPLCPFLASPKPGCSAVVVCPSQYGDRKSIVWGKSGSERVDLYGGRS